MNDTTSGTNMMDLADAARELGVTVQVCLSLIQRGLLDAQRVRRSYKVSALAVGACRRRLAITDSMAGLPLKPAGLRRMLLAMVQVHCERLELTEAVASAAAAGEREEALALQRALDIAATALPVWDESAGQWYVSLVDPG